MKHVKALPVFLSVLLFLASCNKDETDKEYPAIDIILEEKKKKNCDTVYAGETFDVVVRLTDNMELGSYSVDLHHNFDHHSHTTEIEQCDLDPEKDPVNPFVYIEGRDIPEGLKEFTTNLPISIPPDIDKGDYHFMIRVTDKEGWQSLKGFGIKILER